MAFDAFIQFDSVVGECQDALHIGWSEIMSFNIGASAPHHIPSALGGASSARVDWSNFSVVKWTDNATPFLMQYLCMGKHFILVTVQICQNSGTKLPILTYVFDEVIITSLQTSGSAGGDSRPLESLSFAFGKVTVTYNPIDLTGAPTTIVPTSWDLRTNQLL